MGNKNCKISIRLTAWQEQVLHEMCDALGVSYSLLVRTIIGDWLTTNEDHIYRIIDKNRIDNAKNQQTGEKTKA